MPIKTGLTVRFCALSEAIENVFSFILEFPSRAEGLAAWGRLSMMISLSYGWYHILMDLRRTIIIRGWRFCQAP